jgi:uncharacterized protein (DUF488 family)
METFTLYTAGYSGISLGQLITIAKKLCVDRVVDIRSAPYSQALPDFNRENLQSKLTAAGIKYSFAGHKLGGRPQDTRYYNEDQTVNFHALVKSTEFKKGIVTLHQLVTSGEKVLLLCAERDYKDCHRWIVANEVKMVTMANIKPQHICVAGNKVSLANGIMNTRENYDMLSKKFGENKQIKKAA